MIKLGLVGIGFIGQVHFRTHLQHEGTEIVAVADYRPERVAERTEALGGNIGEAETLDLSGYGRYTSLEELLEHPGLDCVDLCTPTHLHADMAIRALEAGKHVICEKPMARTSAEADRMIAAARSSGRMLFVAQCIRFWPAYEALAEMVQAGKLGHVSFAKFTRLSTTPTWSESNWLMDPALSGGALLDLHIHDADFVASLWGLPAAVHASGGSLITPGQKVDHVLTTYHYHDCVCVAEGGWGFPAGFPFTMAYRVLGDRGVMDWKIGEGPSPTFYPRGGEPRQVEVAPESGYQREMRYFMACMEQNRQPDRVTPETARDSVRLIEAEAESVERGEPVLL